MRFFSYFTPSAPWVFVYMVQQFEYNPTKFLKWAVNFSDLRKAQNRGKLHITPRIKLMLVVAYLAYFASIIMIVSLALWHNAFFAIGGIIFVPFFCISVVYVVTVVLQKTIINPVQNRETLAAIQKLASSKALRIAVLGSYGKTTMKELLVTVISEARKIIATPGNKNILISQVRWVNNSTLGNEDVYVFEYGEAKPGDIAKLAHFSKPEIAIITGIAPAHMDAYPDLDSIVKDFASISSVVNASETYFNNQKLLKDNIKGSAYDIDGLGKWKVSNVSVSITGTDFTLSNGNDRLELRTGLLGMHQIGPITAVVVIAKKLGLSNQQIITGVSKTTPFEHRMHPRQLGGAWIIDDTYNGNVEGMRAGLELLKALSAKRKIYVTPGLVDQGTESENIHKQLGDLIAQAKPDKVVLMQNSVTSHIQAGLSAGNYDGEVTIENNPLEYYTNLEHFLAAGDLVMLQNDWPDSYR